MSGQQHLEIVDDALDNLRRELNRLEGRLNNAKRHPDSEEYGNLLSEQLGKIHSLGENAMNDYRVERKVAKVERRWRAEFEKQQKANRKPEAYR